MAERRAFLMRVSPEVLAAVEKLASAELRSVNAQVETLLREALAKRGASRREEESSGAPADVPGYTRTETRG